MELINPPGFGTAIRSYAQWTVPGSFNATSTPTVFAQQSHTGCLVGDIIVIQSCTQWTQSVATGNLVMQIADAGGVTNLDFGAGASLPFGFAFPAMPSGQSNNFAIHCWGRVLVAGARNVQITMIDTGTAVGIFSNVGGVNSWVLKGT
jgi:hypothetical protein